MSKTKKKSGKGEIFDAPQSNEIADLLQGYVDRASLAGAVAVVADKKRILSTTTVGCADIAARKPMKLDTLFWIASQTKPITATLVMMLVEEGKISLDDPIEKYLPEFEKQWVVAESDDEHISLKRPARGIVVADLMRHTSGMRFASAIETPTLDGLPLKDAVRSYAMTPLDYEPGAEFRYSNAGVNTAARIAEVVTGESYESLLESRLLKPLEMDKTSFVPSKSQAKRIANAYKPDAESTGLEETPISQLTYPLSLETRYPMPAGGLFSTAGDVVKFCRVFLGKGKSGSQRYLNAETVSTMTRKQTADTVEQEHGLGWWVHGDMFEHGGALATNMAIYRNVGLITVYLVQHAGFPNDGGESCGKFRDLAVKLYGGGDLV